MTARLDLYAFALLALLTVLPTTGAAQSAPEPTVSATCGYNAERQRLEVNVLNNDDVPVIAWVASALVIDGGSTVRLGVGRDGALGLINPQRWTTPLQPSEGHTASLRVAPPGTGCMDARVDLVVFGDGTFEGAPRVLQDILDFRRRQAAGAQRLLEKLATLSVCEVRASRGGGLFADDGASRAFSQQLSAIWVRPQDDRSAQAGLLKTVADLRDWASLNSHQQVPAARRR